MIFIYLLLSNITQTIDKWINTRFIVTFSAVLSYFKFDTNIFSRN